MKQISILYVEDDPITRTMMSRQLKNEFEQVYEAGDGAEGLEEFNKHQPDLIITDLSMPKMSGQEMLSIIFSKRPDQKTIILTGQFDGIVSGLNCVCLHKPIGMTEILEQIELIVGND